MRIIILIIALVVIPAFWSRAQVSEELKTAKQEIKESYQKLVDIKTNDELTQEEKDRQELEALKAALEDIINFSVTETKNLIAKISAIKGLPVEYAELQDQYLVTLKGFLNYQGEYLETLKNENLNLLEVKKMAIDFKVWRESVYDPVVKKILNFILVFQSSDIAATANARFVKIAGDLRLLKNSKIIKVELLMPLLEQAGSLIKEAAQLNQQAARLLIATDTPSDTTDIGSLLKTAINKIREAYGKFLEMSGLVKKMVSKP